MTDELLAAADRLRKLYAGVDYFEVYKVEPTSHGHQQRDESRIVDALLPELDPEPITREWLDSLGCKRSDWPTGTSDFDIPCDDFDLRIRIWDSEWVDPEAIIRNSNNIGNIQHQVETRGQLRTLCRALGVELREAKS